MSRNKSVPLSIALAFSASLAFGAAHAQQDQPIQPGQEVDTEDFSSVDKDRDKYVSSGEFEEWQSSIFGEMDADRNQELTEVEFLVIKKVRPGEEEQMEARKRQRFEELDEDSDGKVTREQFIEHGSQLFDEADTNGDGKLTTEEFEAAKRKSG